MTIEELKRKIILVDQDTAILNNDLKKLLEKIKRELDIDVDEFADRLQQLEDKDVTLARKITKLFSKAQAALKGIDHDRPTRAIR